MQYNLKDHVRFMQQFLSSCERHGYRQYHGLRTPNEDFSLKSRTFELGQTNWVDKFWGIWGIFGQTISTHFGTVSPLSIFSIIQPLFLQKSKALYSNWSGTYLFCHLNSR